MQIGPIQFQPAEFAKLGIVIFLASYLRDTRQLLVQGARRFLGLTLPPLKHFGPLLVVWGLAMLMLLVIRDLGSSVMFFGAFLSLLYVATNRLSFPRSPAVPGLDFDPMASDQSPTFYLGMIFFENRFPLFGIML